MKNTEIVFILPNLHIGGAQRVAIDLANSLAMKKNVNILLFNSSGDLQDEINKNIKIIDLKSRRSVFAILKLARYLKEYKPQCIFSSQPHATVITWVAKKISNWNGKFVTRETNSFSEDIHRKLTIKEKLERKMLKYVYQKIDVLIAPSQGLKKEILKNISLNLQEKIFEIPNPINLRKIKEKSYEPIPEHIAKKKFVLSVGRFIEQKNFEDLIIAFSKIKLDCNLILLGDGPLMERISNLIEKLDLKNKVFLLGMQKNPFKFMSKCATFVLTSKWEGLPNVLIQALSCGAKIVATDCNHGPREILENGKFGELVPVGDVEKLSAAIEKSLKQDSIKSFDANIEKYNIDRVSNKLEKILFN